MGGIGHPSERELMLQGNARLWEGLIPFVALFDEEKPGPVAQRPEPAPYKSQKAPKHEYDYRVVVANARRD